MPPVKTISHSQKTQVLSFEKKLKLYFSSLSIRGNKFIYCNLPNYKNVIVLSNGDYSLLSKYQPVTLSFHVIEDIEFCQELLQFLNIDKTNKPYIFRTELLMKSIKNNKIEEVKSILDDMYNIKIIVNDALIVEDTDTNDEDFDDDDGDLGDILPKKKKEIDFDDNPFEELDDEESKVVLFTTGIVGKTIDDEFALLILEEHINKILDYKTCLMNNDLKLKSNEIIRYKEFNYDLTKPEYLIGNYFKSNIKLEISDFFNINNVSSNEYNTCHFVFIDGADGVSLKEFIPKFKNKEDLNVKLYVWSENNYTLKSMVIYINGSTTITTCRPYIELIPLKKGGQRIYKSKESTSE